MEPKTQTLKKCVSASFIARLKAEVGAKKIKKQFKLFVELFFPVCRVLYESIHLADPFGWTTQGVLHLNNI